MTEFGYWGGVVRGKGCLKDAVGGRYGTGLRSTGAQRSGRRFVTAPTVEPIVTTKDKFRWSPVYDHFA